MAISTENLKKLMNQLYDHDPQYALAARDELDDLTRALAAEVIKLREAQRWIPVSEQLPETFKDVLVLSNGAISINKHVTGYRHGGIWAGGNRDEDITHWMPLPAAPAGDQQ